MEKVGIVWPFEIYYGNLVGRYILSPFGNLVAVWYIFPRFGILCLEKSGNPDVHHFFRGKSSTKAKILVTLVDCPLLGCQMVYFQTKKPNLGKFWRALDWEMLIYIMAI
jgi:hypothetical protein